MNEAPPRQDGFVYKRRSEGSIQTRKEPREVGYKISSALYFGNYQAAEFFYRHLGEYSGGKVLSPSITTHRGLMPLIAGFFDGDGTQRSNQQQDSFLYTNSKVLAMQFRRILLDHGSWNSLKYVKRRSSGSRQFVLNIKANEAARVAWHSERMREVEVGVCRRIEKTSEGYWVPIRLSRKPYSGYVFDLSIEGEHSYVVSDFAVHNSYGYHDDRFQAINMVLWASHGWTYDIDSSNIPVISAPLHDFQTFAPTLDESMTFSEWKENATADWDW
jgi:hypothetical protein